MDRAKIAHTPPFRKRSASPLHICFVAPYAWPVLSGNRDVTIVGGAEIQQCHLARGLAQRGYRVSMLCLDYGQPPQVEIDGVRVYRLCRQNAGLPALRFLYPRLSSLWFGLRAADADIYYQRGSDMHTGVVAAFSRIHGKRSIFAGASDADFLPGKPWIKYGRDKWLFEYGLRKVDRVIAQTPAQQRLCSQTYGLDATTIPSCYPMPSAKADPAGSVLWVGTIRKIKSPERFIELARRLPDHRFTMVGGPSGDDAENLHYFESIRRMAESVPNLAFIGFVHQADVEQYFDRAWLFVNTSDTEGFPNTFLQAWSRGIPTVSLFDTGSLEEGRPVCVTAQHFEGMIERLSALSCDGALWRETGERCRQHYLRHHSLASVLDSYERLFQTLWEGNHDPRSA